MIRQDILHIIDTYRTHGLNLLSEHKSFCMREELEILARLQFFVEDNEDCFSRGNLKGHITGSAFVVSEDMDEIVLTHHKKLGKWLQLGGHADGNPNIQIVAETETREESGLYDIKTISLISNTNHIIPFDFDVHYIPPHKETPEHFHYDLRYLIVSEDRQLTISDESNDLKWFRLDDAKSLNLERSMHRQFDKLSLLKILLK